MICIAYVNIFVIRHLLDMQLLKLKNDMKQILVLEALLTDVTNIFGKQTNNEAFRKENMMHRESEWNIVQSTSMQI